MCINHAENVRECNNLIKENTIINRKKIEKIKKKRKKTTLSLSVLIPALFLLFNLSKERTSERLIPAKIRYEDCVFLLISYDFVVLE